MNPEDEWIAPYYRERMGKMWPPSPWLVVTVLVVIAFAMALHSLVERLTEAGILEPR